MSNDAFNRPPRAYDPHASVGPPTDRRQAHSSAPASDPLLELARLIGQSDPFAPAPTPPGPVHGAPDPQDHGAAGWPPLRDDRAADRYDGDPLHLQAAPSDRFANPPFFPERRPAPDHFESLADETSAAADAWQEPRSYDVAGGDYADPQEFHDEAAQAHEGEYAEDGEYAPDDQYAYGDDPGEDYGDVPAPVLKRRNTTKVVIAVLGLAVFGSAAAFGYRTVFKGGTQGTPVIRADNSPTKVVPTPSSADAGTKAINDRLGDGPPERVVSREESPVDIRDPLRNPNAGAVVPGTGSFVGVGGFPAASAPPATSAPGAPRSPTDPKPVRTVTIRPDQPGATSPERSIPPPRVAARASAASAAPLPLTPQSVAAADPAPAPSPPRVQQVPPAPAMRPTTDGGGAFVVQLSAQKSEAEAQSTFRALQSKYAMLSGRQPLIRRKDQGERGVFYAAQVGPFGSKEEANQLCESLKSAGGNCFITRN